MKKLWRDCKKFAFCYDVDNKNKHVTDTCTSCILPF